MPSGEEFVQGDLGYSVGRLDHTIVATGPAIFTEPVRLEQAWQRQSGTEIYEFDCAAEWDRSE